MEFSVDCLATKEEGSAFWSSPLLDENPVGVEFDPDEWLARLRTGEPERELLKIDPEGETSPIRGALQTMMA